MKSFRLLLICLLILIFTVSCESKDESIEIVNGDAITLEIGQSIKLEVNNNTSSSSNYQYIENSAFIEIDDNGVITALKEGSCEVIVKVGTYYDSIVVTVIDNSINFVLYTTSNSISVGENITLNTYIYPNSYQKGIYFEVTSGFEFVTLDENVLTGIKEGSTTVVAKVDKYVSNTIVIEIKNEMISTDPYINVDIDEFYQNYDVASSYIDAMYRTEYGLMSGDISLQDQNPTFASNRPSENGVFYRNTSSIYSDDLNTYYVVDANGDVVNKIYRGAAYVTLEEVAAYLMAFGDVPANYTESKKTKPTNSIWGKYLRVNHSYFSGSTSKYPYEPELPNIRGCNGELYYYELDLGTTGTDCDPDYDICIYNDGYKITRGAARLVYTRYDKNENEIIDLNEKYVFYTNNHYNDFREYLNYLGGWGEIFGNITGGGTLSSKYDYNPTKYVETLRKDFTK